MLRGWQSAATGSSFLLPVQARLVKTVKVSSGRQFVRDQTVGFPQANSLTCTGSGVRYRLGHRPVGSQCDKTMISPSHGCVFGLMYSQATVTCTIASRGSIWVWAETGPCEKPPSCVKPILMRSGAHVIRMIENWFLGSMGRRFSRGKVLAQVAPFTQHLHEGRPKVQAHSK